MERECCLMEVDDLLLLSYHKWTAPIAKANNIFFKKQFTSLDEETGKLICIFCRKDQPPNNKPNNFIKHVERDIARKSHGGGIPVVNH